MRLGSKFKNKFAFTLMELMIVVSVIGILVGLAMPIYKNQVEKSKETVDLANIRSAYSQVATEAILDSSPDPRDVMLTGDYPDGKWAVSEIETKLKQMFGASNVINSPKSGGKATVEWDPTGLVVTVTFDGAATVKVYYNNTWTAQEKIDGYSELVGDLFGFFNNNYISKDNSYFGAMEYHNANLYGEAVDQKYISLSTNCLDASIFVAPKSDPDNKTGTTLRNEISKFGGDVSLYLSDENVTKYNPVVYISDTGNPIAIFCYSPTSNSKGTIYYADGVVATITGSGINYEDGAFYATREQMAKDNFDWTTR